MTQARRQGAVSARAAGGQHSVSVPLGLQDFPNLSPRGSAGVSVQCDCEVRASGSESRTSVGECATRVDSCACGATRVDSCACDATRVDSCARGAGESSQAPFSIYDGKMNIPMNF